VAGWFAQSRPAIVTRRAIHARAEEVSLGIPLPLAQGKLRIALQMSRDAILYLRPPVTLEAALASAPPAWQGPLKKLVTAAKETGIIFSVYGSHAWQHLTGEEYITGRSDIDVLWQPQDPVQMQAGLVLLQHWEKCHGLRADGEVCLPGGYAVSWRELVRRTGKVLVKHTHGIGLLPFNEIMNLLKTRTSL
jgi:phosphoribosyl-dephospho-CoA transferase